MEPRIEKYWTCSRCDSGNSLDSSNVPCPRGSCDAEHVGEVITTVKLFKPLPMSNTTWYYQYLIGEDIHYVTELHPEDGILTECFFKTWEEVETYAKENNIKKIIKERI
jgi:hypothetical protein